MSIALHTDKSRLYPQVASGFRDEFLEIVSHELRTPLTPLQLQLQALAQQVPALARDEAAAAALAARIGTLIRQGDRLTRLVNEIVHATEQMSQPAEPALQAVDLSGAVRESLAGLTASGAVDRSKCPIALRLEPDVVGCWDHGRVQQIATNLIDNALRFGAARAIEIEVVREQSSATLTVADHGIGIAQEDQARIFERFERAVSARNYGGLGLGLWIARRAAESLGGSVAVDSELGRGAIFTVRLPMGER